MARWSELWKLLRNIRREAERHLTRSDIPPIPPPIQHSSQRTTYREPDPGPLAFLSTFLDEGFGLAITEASAAGVRIVVSPLGIASRPSVAITVPIDATPVEWAKAIVSSW